MSEIVIKICGLTNPGDARVCAEMGVHMLGLNFSPQSARRITVKRAEEVIGAVRDDFPRLKLIGLFVDQPIDFVQNATEMLELDGVQLHGAETPEFVRRVRAPFVIKALRVTADFSLTNPYDCDAILLDTWNPDQAGGTGETFDWSIAARLRPEIDRLILAGGLRPENVSEAIWAVRPFGVDVCSGVENAPGRKSEDKLRRFVEAVRASEKAETSA
ncbi:MAG: phosphoribosylanthranilate isomerase [Verrucomicrobiota bacterium]|nr:phosphoribosylanthranilate isomerase [Verrucomicrobiota bacterium]